VRESFGEACSAIAHAVRDSLGLEQVLDRIAAATRLIVPVDMLGLWRSEAPDDPVALTLAPGSRPEAHGGSRPIRRADHSPRLWPDPRELPRCVTDAPQELDRTFPGDRRVIELGYRSVLVLPLGSEDHPLGVIWLVHHEPGTYTLEHARELQPVADLGTLAVEHDQLQTLVSERRRRSEALEALLPTLARALDVQTVFSQISEVTREVLAHDYLSVGLVTSDGALRFHASSLGEGVPRLREYRPSTDFGRASLEWDFYIARDYTVLPDNSVRVTYLDPETRRPVSREFKPNPELLTSYTKRGVRSELRVPIWLQTERVGYLFFTSRRPNMYGEEDVALARRVADHVALAIAHERLAEEAKRTTQAQEQATRLQARVDFLKSELEGVSPQRAIGRSRQWRDVLAHATKVAGTDTTVLITGESGTGKEVVARFIHRASPRAERPFVALNCAALPEQLLESELFGFERGAFTGAHASRAGKVEQAAGGVLFLDEVAEMSPPVQTKFLRLLQEREFQRLGGSQTLRADVRVIAATNRDPRIAMERGTLREDLYYRLGVFEIVLPPLRERPEDILVLAEAFLDEIGRGVGRPAAGLSKDARDRLLAHQWPGNIRELRNAIERAVILCEGGLVTGEHLPISIAGAVRGPAPAPQSASTGARSGETAYQAATTDGVALKEAPATAGSSVGPTAIPPEGVSLDAIERELIQKAMAQARNNKSEAARLLGLARGQLYSRLKRHGLDK
jgi:Nif-specific regulatory protein